jgi:hypothetical protein
MPMRQERGISHDRSEETLEAKARWFQSLTMQQRMDYLCEVTDLILHQQPDIARRKHAQSTPGRVRVLTCP